MKVEQASKDEANENIKIKFDYWVWLHSTARARLDWGAPASASYLHYIEGCSVERCKGIVYNAGLGSLDADGAIKVVYMICHRIYNVLRK